MSETNEISSLFTSVLEDRYEGFDLDSSLFRLEEIISSNDANTAYSQLVIDCSILDNVLYFKTPRFTTTKRPNFYEILTKVDSNIILMIKLRMRLL